MAETSECFGVQLFHPFSATPAAGVGDGGCNHTCRKRVTVIRTAGAVTLRLPIRNESADYLMKVDFVTLFTHSIEEGAMATDAALSSAR
jgi:hypothetical protein